MASTISLGVLRIVVHLPESGSLKSKRQVVGGLLRRIRNEYDVAAAEVGNGDRWQIAELAVACVSNQSRHANEVLSKVLAFVESSSGDLVVAEVSTELLRL